MQMRKAKVGYKLIVTLIVFIFGVALSMPSFLQTEKGYKISLGLDLQGGLNMLLSVKTDEAIVSKIKSIAASVNYFANKEDILIDNFILQDTNFSFEVLDPDEISKVLTMLKNIKGIEIFQQQEKFEISLQDSEVQATKDYAIAQAVETIRNRLDQFGLAEPTVAKQGVNAILVEIPGVKTEEDKKRAKDLIAKAAHLQLMALDDKRQDRAQTISEEEAAGYGDVIYPDSKNPNFKYLVQQIPVLDGSMLVDARVAFDQQNNQPIINFTLNSEGARIFGDYTGANVGKRLAIVLDGKVYSAPRINERIGGGSGQISGGFTIEEASDVAIALRSGALLAPVMLEEERSIGPSLGAESIQKSLISLIGAVIGVFGFMIIYYGIAGIFANLALIANVIILIAVMAFFGATLTLPGMAGIVLTIGMAVDANVIINERIRELLRDGLPIRKCIEKGYENAMSAIIDSNVTTVVTCIALYVYGTGPIKGFAVTMTIGILASMLTAIWGTHGLFELFIQKIEKNLNSKLWFGYKIRKNNASI